MDGCPADGEADDAQDAAEAGDGEMMPGSSDDDPGRPGRPGQMPRGRNDDTAVYRAFSVASDEVIEADKLCDRIAIVDHGKLVALDSPMRLKAAVPGTNVVEASFADVPADWLARLERLPGVERVSGDASAVRLATRSGPATTTALMAEAAAAGVRVLSLAVQSTTLDDVFVHFTGRQLRDALQEPSAADRSVMVARNR